MFAQALVNGLSARPLPSKSDIRKATNALSRAYKDGFLSLEVYRYFLRHILAYEIQQEINRALKSRYFRLMGTMLEESLGLVLSRPGERMK